MKTAAFNQGIWRNYMMERVPRNSSLTDHPSGGCRRRDARRTLYVLHHDWKSELSGSHRRVRACNRLRFAAATRCSDGGDFAGSRGYQRVPHRREPCLRVGLQAHRTLIHKPGGCCGEYRSFQRRLRRPDRAHRRSGNVFPKRSDRPHLRGLLRCAVSRRGAEQLPRRLRWFFGRHRVVRTDHPFGGWRSLDCAA